MNRRLRQFPLLQRLEKMMVPCIINQQKTATKILTLASNTVLAGQEPLPVLTELTFLIQAQGQQAAGHRLNSTLLKRVIFISHHKESTSSTLLHCALASGNNFVLDLHVHQITRKSHIRSPHSHSPLVGTLSYSHVINTPLTSLTPPIDGGRHNPCI